MTRREQLLALAEERGAVKFADALALVFGLKKRLNVRGRLVFGDHSHKEVHVARTLLSRELKRLEDAGQVRRLRDRYVLVPKN